jgi:predicted ribosome quality control (RQC) complex YloA/Tae2 family protein
MLSNYYTLRCIAADLHAQLRGKTVAEIFSQERDELAIGYLDLDKKLVISCRRETNTLFLHGSLGRARRNSADILPGCWRAQIHSVALHPSDRIVSVLFKTGLTLHVHLFGTLSNVFLVDERRLILDTFKNAKNFVGTHYQLTGSPVPDESVSLTTDFDRSPGTTIREKIKAMFPRLGPVLATEAIYRSGLNPSTLLTDIDSQSLELLEGALRSVMTELSAPRPRVYVFKQPTRGQKGSAAATRELPPLFALIPLRHLVDAQENLFNDVHDALRYCISRKHTATRLERRKGVLFTRLSQTTDKAGRSVRAVEHDLSEGHRAESWERCGSLLMANLSAIKKGQRSIELTDEGRTLRVALDPALTPVQNAQQYFAKAKRARVSQHRAQERLASLSSTLSRGEQMLGTLASVNTEEDLNEYLASHATELKAFGISDRPEAANLPLFRVFTVDGGFQVLAGKSSTNNDLLTMKHAKPNDLWFHARGSSGSHVILRIASARGEPSKKAKEQAAGIAAYYSRMKKATLVPVAMAEKKYVRKPKGALPGTVVLEREKIIFAEPALPPTAKD